MSITSTTHLNFRGEARAALEFYHSVFGGEVVAVTYEDAHNVARPEEAKQIMWGQVASDNGFRIMAYDVPSTLPFGRGEGSFFVSIRSESTDEITTLWAKLSDGARVVQELGPAGWAPLYGMLSDRFGITWVLDVATPYDES